MLTQTWTERDYRKIQGQGDQARAKKYPLKKSTLLVTDLRLKLWGDRFSFFKPLGFLAFDYGSSIKLTQATIWHQPTMGSHLEMQIPCQQIFQCECLLFLNFGRRAGLFRCITWTIIQDPLLKNGPCLSWCSAVSIFKFLISSRDLAFSFLTRHPDIMELVLWTNSVNFK